MREGKVVFTYNKNLLPTYDVFDEARYFESGDKVGIFDIMGTKIGITICEDMWTIKGFNPFKYSKDPVSELANRGAQIIINISASPYFAKKIHQVKKIN